MTQTATTATCKPATVRIVREGMNLSRFSIATGALLGSMHYSEWDGYYTITNAVRGRSIRTMDRDRAHHVLALCA